MAGLIEGRVGVRFDEGWGKWTPIKMNTKKLFKMNKKCQYEK